MDFTDGLQDSVLPLGLAFGLAKDEQAVNNYGGMTEYEKEKLLAESKDAKSEEEIQQLKQKLNDGDSMM